MDDTTKKQLEKLDKIPEEYFIGDVLPINGGLITLVKPQQPYFYDDLKNGRHYEDEPIDYFPDVDNVEIELGKDEKPTPPPEPDPKPEPEPDDPSGEVPEDISLYDGLHESYFMGDNLYIDREKNLRSFSDILLDRDYAYFILTTENDGIQDVEKVTFELYSDNISTKKSKKISNKDDYIAKYECSVKRGTVSCRLKVSIFNLEGTHHLVALEDGVPVKRKYFNLIRTVNAGVEFPNPNIGNFGDIEFESYLYSGNSYTRVEDSKENPYILGKTISTNGWVVHLKDISLGYSLFDIKMSIDDGINHLVIFDKSNGFDSPNLDVQHLNVSSSGGMYNAEYIKLPNYLLYNGGDIDYLSPKGFTGSDSAVLYKNIVDMYPRFPYMLDYYSDITDYGFKINTTISLIIELDAYGKHYENIHYFTYTR